MAQRSLGSFSKDWNLVFWTLEKHRMKLVEHEKGAIVTKAFGDELVLLLA
jgi:hypothetical protein